ncbi:MAG: methyltransferase domain-containing protein [Proteobacteria bacterium]|nr:methyltransferase domain-containing protein [Pseudomonadota bacterium]
MDDYPMNLDTAIRSARAFGFDTRRAYQNLMGRSLASAIREQGLTELCVATRQIIPDLQNQYSGGFDPVEFERYWEIKLRGLHAWQTRCALDAVSTIGGGGLNIVDIGDSSGHHLTYLRETAPVGALGRMAGLNLDPAAVERIRACGFEAILGRAENLSFGDIHPDLVISFQTLEHLTDPVRFLHNLAAVNAVEHVLITVPYRRDSRFGGSHLRLPLANMPARMTAEEVHVFEFSPADWQLLAQFAGYRTIKSDIYFQYPRRSILRGTAPLWRRSDFEGFVSLLLLRDLSVTSRYGDW